MSATITNGQGETFFVVTMWADLAQDHVTANVWAADRFDALLSVRRDMPEDTHRLEEIRHGAASDLD